MLAGCLKTTKRFVECRIIRYPDQKYTDIVTEDLLLYIKSTFEIYLSWSTPRLQCYGIRSRKCGQIRQRLIYISM